MAVERRPKTTADLKSFQDHHHHNQYLVGAGDIMDVRSGNKSSASSTGTFLPKTNIMMNGSSLKTEGKRIEYRRSLSQGKRIFSASYLSFEGLFLLVCLTASLLLLPIILPPLPPPPFMLLLLPIFLLALLMILAFMPSNARDVTTCTYL